MLDTPSKTRTVVARRAALAAAGLVAFVASAYPQRPPQTVVLNSIMRPTHSDQQGAILHEARTETPEATARASGPTPPSLETAANNGAPTVTGVTVTPNPATAIIGRTLQFSAAVSGSGNYKKTVKWSVAGPSNWSGSAGSISSSGLYETPYPAPPAVTVTATSFGNSNIIGKVTVMLRAPAQAAGPALQVDAGNELRAINPYIYGMNAYQLEPSTAQAAGISLARWGGDNTSRYNYQLGVTNTTKDIYFENRPSATSVGPTGEFDDLVTSDASMGIRTMGTVPVLGWVAKDGTSCSFPLSAYPEQQTVDRSRDCGNGVYPNGVNGCTNAAGCTITGESPTVTSIAEGPAFAGSWVAYLVQRFGKAADGGVAMYDLDNEPGEWDAQDRDVHPQPFTYDELVNNDIATALAIKTADPTAEVNGPVIDYWWNYFYSKKDLVNGWNTGPCDEGWDNPVDREAHGGVAFIDYYLQQFAKYAAANKTGRLLDYLDLHTYFAAYYNGSSVGLTTAGDTGEQEARLNSTRVFWDPTYTDPNYPQPNYITDANYTPSCSPPLQAPRLIPRMQAWAASDYPGTKTAISEYNWGGLEHINGALSQADILGIFGQYALDLATLWAPPNASQVPGLMAFEIYRNYDGAGSQFGDIALASTSAAQGQLSVYGARRSFDQAVTIVVINKTYGALTSTLSIAHLKAADNAKVYQYSSSNLASIVALPDQPVKAPPSGSTTSTIAATFPGASITLLVIPTEATAPDFGIAANPTSITTSAGANITTNITVSPSGGFTGPVTLSLSGLPSGAGYTFSPNVVPVPGNAAATSTLAINSTSLASGTYSLTVAASADTQAGVLSHAVSLPLKITSGISAGGFRIAGNDLTLNAGSVAGSSTGVVVTPYGGFTGAVHLTCGITVSPAGASNLPTCSLNPTSLSITGTADVTSTLTIDTSAAATVGKYIVTVTGTSGTTAATGTVMVDVDNFSISALPISIAAGAVTNNTSTVTVTPSSSGFTGTVDLTCALQSSPTGATDLPGCSLHPPSVNLSGTTTGTSTIAISSTAPSSGALIPLRSVFGAAGGTALASILMLGIPTRRKPWQTVFNFLIIALAIAIAGVVGCGVTISRGDEGNVGRTTSGTYVFTVTGSAGGASSTGAITVTIH